VISLREARELVLAGCRPCPPRSVPLADALGLVLAEPVVAPHPVPPFTTSAMDGYAVRAADTRPAPARLSVIGSVLAGSAPDVEVGPRQAVRIMTGAPLPEGADAVCMIELTRPEGDGVVVVEEPVDEGRHVRRPGEDVVAGQLVFDAGEVLSPGHLGVLASLGLYRAHARARPRVGVLSTGDELVEGPEPLSPGKIRDANRHSLLATLRRDGFDTCDLGIAGDDLGEITARIAKGAEGCDALVTSGGVSVGDVDYVKVALDDLSGGTMRWMQVAIRPAKPLAFGNLAADGTPVFGLPGNPVSALVSYELFVRPGLRRMAGHAVLDRPLVTARADEPLTRRPDGKVHFVRVRARFGPEGLLHVRSSGGQESHQLRAMAGANALAVLPDGQGVGAGDEVEVLLTDPADLGRGSPGTRAADLFARLDEQADLAGAT